MLPLIAALGKGRTVDEINTHAHTQIKKQKQKNKETKACGQGNCSTPAIILCSTGRSHNCHLLDTEHRTRLCVLHNMNATHMVRPTHHGLHTTTVCPTQHIGQASVSHTIHDSCGPCQQIFSLSPQPTSKKKKS